MLSSILSILGYSSIISPQFSQTHEINEINVTNQANTSNYNSISVAAYPEKQLHQIRPIIQAKAALSIDLETNKILFEQNSNQELPIASLTKLMTVLIILEENQLDEIVTVPYEATTVEPVKIYLVANEKISVENLIKAAIIRSGNDAAIALAIHNAGSQEKFIEKMNQKAKELGMKNTHFSDVKGFDREDNYSTTSDLAILAKKVYQNSLIKNIAPIQEMEISSADQKIKHQLIATNDLLSSYLKVLGLKTGTTDEAGQCLISIVENQQGNQIMNIMLNSPNRFQESKVLSEWIFISYNWI